MSSSSSIQELGSIMGDYFLYLSCMCETSETIAERMNQINKDLKGPTRGAHAALPAEAASDLAQSAELAAGLRRVYQTAHHAARRTQSRIEEALHQLSVGTAEEKSSSYISTYRLCVSQFSQLQRQLFHSGSAQFCSSVRTKSPPVFSSGEAAPSSQTGPPIVIVDSEHVTSTKSDWPGTQKPSSKPKGATDVNKVTGETTPNSVTANKLTSWSIGVYSSPWLTHKQDDGAGFDDSEERHVPSDRDLNLVIDFLSSTRQPSKKDQVTPTSSTGTPSSHMKDPLIRHHSDYIERQKEKPVLRPTKSGNATIGASPDSVHLGDPSSDLSAMWAGPVDGNRTHCLPSADFSQGVWPSIRSIWAPQPQYDSSSDESAGGRSSTEPVRPFSHWDSVPRSASQGCLPRFDKKVPPPPGFSTEHSDNKGRDNAGWGPVWSGDLCSNPSRGAQKVTDASYNKTSRVETKVQSASNLTVLADQTLTGNESCPSDLFSAYLGS